MLVVCSFKKLASLLLPLLLATFMSSWHLELLDCLKLQGFVIDVHIHVFECYRFVYLKHSIYLELNVKFILFEFDTRWWRLSWQMPPLTRTSQQVITSSSSLRRGVATVRNWPQLGTSCQWHSRMTAQFLLLRWVIVKSSLWYKICWLVSEWNVND